MSEWYKNGGQEGGVREDGVRPHRKAENKERGEQTRLDGMVG